MMGGNGSDLAGPAGVEVSAYSLVRGLFGGGWAAPGSEMPAIDLTGFCYWSIVVLVGRNRRPRKGPTPPGRRGAEMAHQTSTPTPTAACAACGQPRGRHLWGPERASMAGDGCDGWVAPTGAPAAPAPRIFPSLAQLNAERQVNGLPPWPSAQAVVDRFEELCDLARRNEAARMRALAKERSQ